MVPVTSYTSIRWNMEGFGIEASPLRTNHCRQAAYLFELAKGQMGMCMRACIKRVVQPRGHCIADVYSVLSGLRVEIAWCIYYPLGPSFPKLQWQQEASTSCYGSRFSINVGSCRFAMGGFFFFTFFFTYFVKLSPSLSSQARSAQWLYSAARTCSFLASATRTSARIRPSQPQPQAQTWADRGASEAADRSQNAQIQFRPFNVRSLGPTTS